MPRFRPSSGLAEELRPTRGDTPSVHVERVPAGNIQPHVQAAEDGSLHLIYFVGSAKGGNLIYEHRTEEPGDTWRVNSERNTAVAMGTIRGAQLALTEDGTVHVVWNGARREGAGQSPGTLSRPNNTRGRHHLRVGPRGSSRGSRGPEGHRESASQCARVNLRVNLDGTSFHSKTRVD